MQNLSDKIEKKIEETKEGGQSKLLNYKRDAKLKIPRRKDD